MIGTIAVIVLVIIVVVACCSSSGNNSSNNTNNNTYNNVSNQRRTSSHRDYCYSECPSCGSPYYDGYCDECGYSDINQGWLGEQ